MTRHDGALCFYAEADGVDGTCEVRAYGSLEERLAAQGPGRSVTVSYQFVLNAASPADVPRAVAAGIEAGVAKSAAVRHDAVRTELLEGSVVMVTNRATHAHGAHRSQCVHSAHGPHR